MPRVERRLIWMDNFRGLAIFLVIFHHAVSIMSWRGEGANPLAVVVNDATAGFRMPGLILLSGMLVERSLRKGSRPYLLGKVRNILWPFVLWVLVTALLTERRVTWSTVQEIVTPAHGILWFLWFLFAFYVLYWLSRNLNPAAVAICSFALSTVLPNWHKADRLAHLFGFFVIGILAARHLDVLTTWLKNRSISFALFAVVLAVSAQSAVTPGIKYNAFYAAPLLLTIAGVVRICMFLETFRLPTKFLSFIGRNSLVYYVCHWPVISLLYDYLARDHQPRTSVAVVSLCIASLLSGWLISMLRERSKIVQAVFAFPDFKSAMSIRRRHASPGKSEAERPRPGPVVQQHEEVEMLPSAGDQ